MTNHGLLIWSKTTEHSSREHGRSASYSADTELYLWSWHRLYKHKFPCFPRFIQEMSLRIFTLSLVTFLIIFIYILYNELFTLKYHVLTVVLKKFIINVLYKLNFWMTFVHLVEMRFASSNLWKWIHNKFLFTLQRVFIKTGKKWSGIMVIFWS